MDLHQNEIIVTMISVGSPPQTAQQHNEKKPPKVPPRTKKRLQTKECETVITTTTTTTTTTSTTLVDEQAEATCPEIPSRTKEPVIPPPIPSAVKPNKRAVLQTRQLLESEFLKASNPQREVLVAATKTGKDKRPEARQRQPAMLIRPNQDPAKIVDRREFEASENSAPRSDKGRKGPTFLVLPNSKALSPIPHHHRGMFPGRNAQVPLLTRVIFPRPPNTHPHAVAPTGPPVSYGKWLEKSGNGDPEINTRILRRIFGGHQMPFKSAKSSHNNIGQAGSSYKNLVPPGHKNPMGQLFSSKSKLVVSRSGSLSSQCSTSSDSGNEGQPKSVLKKSRRNKGMEKPKKSVTFNAMTTVQVMEE